MGKSILYKYLDAKGGLMMLYYSNLQFTNATKFNDPFDCHPALFDYSNVPETKNNWPPKDFLSHMGENRMERQRNSTWISCFSKVYDSLLMWAYYNGHKGVCIGLNKEALLEYLQRKFFGLMPPFAREVKYKDILPKIDYFKDYTSWTDILTIKAKAWEHEQEVRLITKEPAWIDAKRCIPDELKGEELIDGKEIRHYPSISSECFESLYLGIKICKEDKEKLIKVAKKLNPNIKIYKMTIDSEALRLKGEIIES